MEKLNKEVKEKISVYNNDLLVLEKLKKHYKKNNNEVICRGSGNYSSDEAKELARLKKELKDTQDALEILKKAISILGK